LLKYAVLQAQHRNFRANQRSFGDNTQFDLTDDELLACRDELDDAAELLGVEYED